MREAERVIVEFYGVPRLRAGRAELAVPGGTLREVLAERPERARVSWEGNTPLMWLPPEDEGLALEVVELMLEHGTDPSLRSAEDGTTAADRAEQLGMFRVAERLRDEMEARTEA